MDNRRLIIAMLLAMFLVPIWLTVIYPRLGKGLGYDMTPPKPTTLPAQLAATSSPASRQAEVSLSTQPAAVGEAPVIAEGVLRVIQGTGTAPLTLGSVVRNDPDHRLGLTLDPRGAGINQVVLNRFKQAVDREDPYTYQTPYPGNESISRPLATRSVWIDGTEVPVSDALWTIDNSDATSATFSLTIARGQTPVVRVLKTIQLLPPSDPSQGYEVNVQHTFRNLTQQPVNIRTKFNGTVLPPIEQETGGDRQVLSGYVNKGFVLITHNMAEEFTSTPTLELKTDSSGNPSVWAGTNSIYFNALVRPLPLDPANPVPDYVTTVTAHSVAVVNNRPQVVMTYDTADQTIAPSSEVALSARAFFGPRMRALLKNDYYAAFPIGYDKTLVLTSGPCAFCTFDWLVNMLVAMLAGFNYLFGGFAGKGDWGLAIIALVVVVRVLLHPISKKSQIAMARMGKMAPEMERLKKKYGDDKEQLQKAMMELYKEQGVAPMLGCLPMLLQMPIWIALWQSLQTTFELRHAPFLWGWTWIDDLSQPDRLLAWAPVKVFFFTVSGLNILPILMGVVFYLQMKYQPKPATMTKEQEQQQKMMMWMMPFLFPVMLYSGPSGLNLYILTSTMIGIVESKKIRDHLKEQDEREKAGRVIVDGGKKFKGGGGKEGSERTSPGSKPKPSKPGGLTGWLQNLQEKADQIRRDADKKK